MGTAASIQPTYSRRPASPEIQTIAAASTPTAHSAGEDRRCSQHAGGPPQHDPAHGAEEQQAEAAEQTDLAGRGVGVDLDHASVQLILRQVVVDAVLGGIGLLLLVQDETLQHEDVHVRGHEAAVGVLG
jgi:hypothetical protein